MKYVSTAIANTLLPIWNREHSSMMTDDRFTYSLWSTINRSSKVKGEEDEGVVYLRNLIAEINKYNNYIVKNHKRIY